MYGACEDIPMVREAYAPHHGTDRAYMRDVILGVNDGLVSMLLLTSGIVAGGLTIHAIRLSIVSGAIAGMISMSFGEYLATKSQEEVLNGELELEKKHIQTHPDMELEQARMFLGELFRIKNQDVIDSFVNELKTDTDALFSFMKVVEFGATDNDRRYPLIAMIVSGGLFLAGSIPSMIAFSVSDNNRDCFFASIGLNALALFMVGSLKTLYTGGNLVVAGMENLWFGSTGAILSYGVGLAFGIRS